MSNKKKVMILEMGSKPLTKLNEDVDNGQKYVFEGPCAEFGVTNENYRKYNKEDYLEQFNYLLPKINENSLLGELDHRDEYSVSMKTVSHMITGLRYDEETDQVMIKIELLPTDEGKKVMAMADKNIPIHISSRASGYIDDDGNVTLERIYTYDIVHEPGFKNARLKRVSESKNMSIYEWAEKTPSVNNGKPAQINEDIYERLKTEMTTQINMVKNMVIETRKDFIKQGIGGSVSINENAGEKSIFLEKLFTNFNELCKIVNRQEATMEGVVQHSERIGKTHNEVWGYLEILSDKVNEMINFINGKFPTFNLSESSFQDAIGYLNTQNYKSDVDNQDDYDYAILGADLVCVSNNVADSIANSLKKGGFKTEVNGNSVKILENIDAAIKYASIAFKPDFKVQKLGVLECRDNDTAKAISKSLVEKRIPHTISENIVEIKHPKNLLLETAFKQHKLLKVNEAKIGALDDEDLETSIITCLNDVYQDDLKGEELYNDIAKRCGTDANTVKQVANYWNIKVDETKINEDSGLSEGQKMSIVSAMGKLGIDDIDAADWSEKMDALATETSCDREAVEKFAKASLSGNIEEEAGSDENLVKVFKFAKSQGKTEEEAIQSCIRVSNKTEEEVKAILKAAGKLLNEESGFLVKDLSPAAIKKISVGLDDLGDFDDNAMNALISEIEFSVDDKGICTVDSNSTIDNIAKLIGCTKEQASDAIAKVLNSNQDLFEGITDADVEKGGMHKALGIPEDDKITDHYSSGEELANALVNKVGKEKASSMLSYAANINSDADPIFGAALKAVSDKEKTSNESKNNNMIKECMDATGKEITSGSTVKVTGDKVSQDIQGKTGTASVEGDLVYVTFEGDTNPTTIDANQLTIVEQTNESYGPDSNGKPIENGMRVKTSKGEGIVVDGEQGMESVMISVKIDGEEQPEKFDSRNITVVQPEAASEAADSSSIVDKVNAYCINGMDRATAISTTASDLGISTDEVEAALSDNVDENNTTLTQNNKYNTEELTAKVNESIEKLNKQKSDNQNSNLIADYPFLTLVTEDSKTLFKQLPLAKKQKAKQILERSSDKSTKFITETIFNVSTKGDALLDFESKLKDSHFKIWEKVSSAAKQRVLSIYMNREIRNELEMEAFFESMDLRKERVQNLNERRNDEIGQGIAEEAENTEGFSDLGYSDADINRSLGL